MTAGSRMLSVWSEASKTFCSKNKRRVRQRQRQRQRQRARPLSQHLADPHPVNSLQMSQADLQALLQSTQNTEREARRDLTNASEEIAALRTSHLREIDDLERQVARKDREK